MDSSQDSASTGLVVALDGPASSGKSSVGAAAALELNYRFCDTGLLYRALTWLALRRGIPPDDAPALVGLVREVELAADDRGRLARVLVDGIDETRDVHTDEVDAEVSAYSRVPEVRAALLERQRSIAGAGRIVMAGRDIGTVVLPDADLKIFLDASAEERAKRRAEERGLAPDGADGRAILAELRRRDELDKTRAVAPLRPADDARILVTDGNRLEDTVAMVVAAIREAEAEAAGSLAGARPAERPPAKARTARDAPEPIGTHITPFIRGFGLFTRLLARSISRVKFVGAIDEIPQDGPVIFAANHISNADPVVIGSWLVSQQDRRLHWMAKREIFEWPVIGWLATHSGIHPVDRSGADMDAWRFARWVLDAGQPLFVFPEGTRSPDGVLQEAKDGVAMLALRTNAQIVPIGITGSDLVWPKGRPLPWPGGRITVRVGRPFRLSDEFPDGVRGRAGKAAATRLLMIRIAELLPERHRGMYAADVAARKSRPGVAASPG